MKRAQATSGPDGKYILTNEGKIQGIWKIIMKKGDVQCQLSLSVNSLIESKVSRE